VTPLGQLLVRNVAMLFDAYLKRAGAKKGFSRTV
jgi:oxygen-independent coproporphyrinogen-3 oxidase